MTGAASYALPARPTKIRAASVITAAGLQMPARVILAEEWASIPDKTRTGLFAEVLFFDAGFPTSNVYLTPKPGAGSLELQSYFPLGITFSAGDTVAFPPGYERSLIAALAVDLATEYGRIRDVVQGPDGFIYFTTSNKDGRNLKPAANDDRVMRLVPAV